MQRDGILHGIEHDHQVWNDDPSVVDGLLRDDAVLHVLLHRLLVGKQAVRVRDGPSDPPVEHVRAARELRGVDDAALLSRPGADEDDRAPGASDARDDFCCAPQVRGGHVEGDDVDPVPHAKDVARVAGVPERRRVSQVGASGHQEF